MYRTQNPDPTRARGPATKRQAGPRSPKAGRRRLLKALVVAAGVAGAIAAWRYMDDSDSKPPPGDDLRMPVANPQLEPERPDLIGEPRIGESPP